MVIYKLGRVAYAMSDYNEAAKHFRDSAAISKDYPLIPAEEARTLFMLIKALEKGAQPLRNGEKADTEARFASLMQAYYDSNGAKDPAPVVDLAQLDVCITAKYQ